MCKNAPPVRTGRVLWAWGGDFLAQHVGTLGGTWSGTDELAALAGKNMISDIFDGSTDANILVMTDDENGDALFVDDIYSAFPDEIAAQSRLGRIDEVRAGAGDDVVDMTSQRFAYTGGGLTIRGGDGNDVIWANSGDNFLFGDAGNDRIVGASGSDFIAGGVGNDSMHGGGGADIFAFCDDWGADTVEQLADGTVTLWFASGDISKASLNTWVFTITRNTVIDHFRRMKPTEELDENLSDNEELDVDLLNRESLGELAAALRSLPQQLMDIIVLRYYDGKPLTEIAELMDLSYGAVKLRHQNAILMLRKALEGRV